MIKTLTITALVVSSFAGSALAGASHRKAAEVPADAASYYSYYDARPTAPATAAPAPASRPDFGSFSAGATARNLGF